MDGAIATAIVGVAGIAATFFAPTWSEARIARSRADREFRVARRLVGAELEVISVQLQALTDSRAIHADDLKAFFPTAEFDTHKTPLANLLPDERWESVANAYSQIGATKFMLRRGGELTEQQMESVRTDVVDVQEAIDALAGNPRSNGEDSA